MQNTKKNWPEIFFFKDLDSIIFEKRQFWSVIFLIFFFRRPILIWPLKMNIKKLIFTNNFPNRKSLGQSRGPILVLMNDNIGPHDPRELFLFGL